MPTTIADTRPLQARLVAVNDAIADQEKIRDSAAKGSIRRKTAKEKLRALKKRRRRLRRDRWKMKGSTAIIKYEVIPAYEAAGVSVTSRKRWGLFGNPSSDHYFGNRDADAADGGTFNDNDELGSEVATVLKNEPATVNGFAEFTITRSHTGSAETYRIQVITEQHGTGPHIHTGCKRVSA